MTNEQKREIAKQIVDAIDLAIDGLSRNGLKLGMSQRTYYELIDGLEAVPTELIALGLIAEDAPVGFDPANV